MGLIEKVGPGPVGLDTSVFIYLIERHSRFLPAVRPLFVESERGRIKLVTSALTLLEVLTMPLRKGASAMAAEYEDLLTRTPSLDLVDINLGQLKSAALLRAHTSMKTPDALQVAAALSRNCTAFITNDKRLSSLPHLPIYQIEDYA